MEGLPCAKYQGKLFTNIVFFFFFFNFWPYLNFSGGSDGKESACNAGDPGSIPGSEEPLEKGVATHSGILAWRFPWTLEAGGLQSMGFQRVRHD